MKQSAKTIIAGTVGAAGLFLASTANANAATTVKVAKNDTVWGLAQKYNVSIKSIETLNNINQNTHLIVTNQSVKIPNSSSSAKATDSKTNSSVTVKSGDTLWDLAKQYNTSVENLQSLNGLSGDLIKPGQVLKVNGTAATTEQDTDTQQKTTTTPSVTVSANHVTYTVKSGDSLYSIAQAYGVSVDSLRSSNSLGSVLTVGQTLTINDPTKAPATTTAASTSTTTTANAASSSTTTTQAAASSSSATSSSAATQASSTTATSSSVATSQASSTTATSSSSATTQASSTVATNSSASKTSSNSSTSTATSSTSTSVSASSVISYAEQFIGVPYVYGGTTPNGFDCSGFVQYVYAHFGVSLPRTSEAQSTIGSAVSVSSAQPGDLIFWGGVGSAYHVGIYLGGTSYIAAPKTGESVSVKSFQYWQPSFAIHMN